MGNIELTEWQRILNGQKNSGLLDQDMKLIWESSPASFSADYSEIIEKLPPSSREQLIMTEHGGKKIAAYISPVTGKNGCRMYYVKLIEEDGIIDFTSLESFSGGQEYMQATDTQMMYELSSIYDRNLRLLSKDDLSKEERIQLEKLQMSVQRSIMYQTNRMAIHDERNSISDGKKKHNISALLQGIKKELRMVLYPEEINVDFSAPDIDFYANIREDFFTLTIINLIYSVLFLSLCCASEGDAQISAAEQDDRMAITFSAPKPKDLRNEKKDIITICLTTAMILAKRDCGGEISIREMEKNEKKKKEKRMVYEFTIPRSQVGPLTLNQNSTEYNAGSYKTLHLFVDEIIKMRKENDLL